MSHEAGTLEAALKRHFGFESFRPNQRGIVEAVAAGVQRGTRFAVAEESPAHSDFKQAMIKASAREAGRQMEEFWVGGLRKAAVEWDVECGSLMAGQSAGLGRQPRS